MLGILIGGFISILVGVALLPTVATSIRNATVNASGSSVGYNVTGAAATVLDLTTLFYCLGIASIGIATAAQGLRAAGILI